MVAEGLSFLRQRQVIFVRLRSAWSTYPEAQTLTRVVSVPILRLQERKTVYLGFTSTATPAREEIIHSRSRS